MTLSRRTVVWLIPTLLAVHNGEEALAFSRMWSHMPEPLATLEGWLPYATLRYALLALSILAFVLAAFVAARPSSTRAMWLLLALEAAIAINVVAHVISAVVVFRGYGPGLVTALLFNAPFAWYSLRRARRDAWVSERAWGMLAVGGLVLHGPVLLLAIALLRA